MADHAAAGNAVHHFRQCGFHACAFARGEDNGGDLGHASVPARIPAPVSALTVHSRDLRRPAKCHIPAKWSKCRDAMRGGTETGGHYAGEDGGNMTSAKLGKLETLVFDLDGTLVDSAPDLASAVNALLGEYDAPPLTEAEVRAMIGDGMGMLISRALAARKIEGGEPGLHQAALARFLALYDGCLTDRTKPYPRVIETLKELRERGFAMAICTNKPFAPTRRILSTLHLDRFFSVVIGGDSLPTRKPAPEPLWAAISQLGRKVEGAAMIGDSANDILCARAAGVAGILIPSDYGAPATDADLTLPDFGALPAALAY
jgi:phosphoglycolate phosphatase